MKKIVLIGDSIRMGYDKYVKEKLSDCAKVYFPKDNCRFAQYILRYLHEWKEQENMPDDADLVHWNAGLWDLLHIYGDDCLTDPETYAKLLPRIVNRIRLLFPQAKIVFATSTPVQEEKYGPYFYGKNAEIEQYNAIAGQVLENLGVVIDDLYTVMKDVPENYYSDVTHFYTPEATERIGNAVLECICPLLGIETDSIKR